jgi:excisionase family DNA binding protein
MSLLTVKELTGQLRISRSSLYRLLNRGDGPRAVKVGGKTLFPAAEADKWLATRRNPFENRPAA